MPPSPVLVGSQPTPAAGETEQREPTLKGCLDREPGERKEIWGVIQLGTCRGRSQVGKLRLLGLLSQRGNRGLRHDTEGGSEVRT